MKAQFLIILFGLGSLFSNAQRIVTSSEIEGRNGVRYVKGETVPYSGILKRYSEDGIFEAEALLSDGKFNGPANSFYKNGNIHTAINYANDIPSGIVKKYNEDGSLIFEGEFIDDLIYSKNKPFSGKIKQYYSNGALREVQSFKKGLREGRWQYWNEQGKLQKEYYYAFYTKMKQRQAGKLLTQEDLCIIEDLYYLKNCSIPFSGKLVNYYPNGSIEGYATLKNGRKTGKMLSYYDSGEKRSLTYENENHESYGPVIIWNEGGTIAFKGEWKNDKLYKKGYDVPFSGTTILSYRYGNRAEEAEFRDGQWHGTQKRWNRQGKLLSECIFKENKIIDCPVFNPK